MDSSKSKYYYILGILFFGVVFTRYQNEKKNWTSFFRLQRLRVNFKFTGVILKKKKKQYRSKNYTTGIVFILLENYVLSLNKFKMLMIKYICIPRNYINNDKYIIILFMIIVL